MPKTAVPDNFVSGRISRVQFELEVQTLIPKGTRVNLAMLDFPVAYGSSLTLLYFKLRHGRDVI